MPLWGPGAPRWFLSLGIVVGLWYLAIPVMVLWRHGPVQNVPDSPAPIIIGIVIGIVGMLAIVGCTRGLRRRM
jgi:hypothetical protein